MSDAALLAPPVAFAFVVAAIVIFGPRRGSMRPQEKAATLRFFWSLSAIAAIGIASLYLERWLSARFGFSYWESLGAMLGFAVVVGLLSQAIRALLERRSERASW